MSFDLKIANGDLQLENGSLKTIVDSEKLIQDILKICLTTAGANPLHPWYGSFISRTLIGNSIDTNIMVQIGKSQLNSALTNLKNLQDIQIKSFQRVSADEQISSISDISINRNQIDARLLDIRVKVISKGFKPVPTSFRIATF